MSNMLKSLLVAAGVAASFAVSGLDSKAVAQAVETATIIIVDSQQIQRESSAGKDILRQIETIRAQFQGEVSKEEETLRAEEAELKRQRQILTPEAFDEKRRAWEQKVVDFQRKLQEKNREFEIARNKAYGEMERAIRPIFQKVLEERKATLMLDKSQIVISAPNRGLDVTTSVIERLDQVLPGVKLELTQAAAE